MTEPLIKLLDPRIPSDATEIARLQDEEGYRYVDTYAEQVAELAETRDPSAVGHAPTPLQDDPGERVAAFPWQKTLVRILDADAYRELRTNRNRELLTQEEQDRFGDACIAFAGLNVGNPGAVCIALEGGSRSMRLADLDPLSLSNLNRFRAGLPDLGINKATLTAQQILEVDPYYKLDLYEQGISPANLETFLDGASLLVEEMDALPLKISIREVAKAKGIPVIMVTGNAEGILLDIERFDETPDLPILNGLMDARVMEAVAHPTGPLAPHDKVALARDFMGVPYLDERLLLSFSAFGTSLVGIPQLAESSFMRGAALCYAAKAIVLGRPLPSGRYAFSFAAGLQLVHHS
ncbi:MAG: UBA/THIF-type binding fold protein [Parcubacteria group bacterium]|jgi:molybdopterin/thiamine biosynthesis adenylyltransferase|nr:UBA/THIF-type binding fold protein [Parcubacteria group bacterium]